ncbi:MAG: GNAT family N-acetyltransferase, partial [Woeseiaceae bacterium]
KMWCDPDEMYHPIEAKRLEADEVYLQMAYVDPDYRGQNIAPLMRIAGYEALREIGKTRFYSYSMYENTRARRFKEKLGARSESLTIHVRWFGKWSICRTFPMRS